MLRPAPKRLRNAKYNTGLQRRLRLSNGGNNIAILDLQESIPYTYEARTEADVQVPISAGQLQFMCPNTNIQWFTI